MTCKTSTIQIKRGLDANLGGVTLKDGELAFTTDKGKLYVGNSGDKTLINPDLGTASEKDTGTTEGTVPVLGPDGKLDPSLIPSMAISEVYVVADESERLGLTEATAGDVAYQEDTKETYMLVKDPASVADNWVVIAGMKAPVTSVNEKTGEVVLEGNDILIPNYTIGTECAIIEPTDTVTVALGKLEYGILNIDGGTF